MNKTIQIFCKNTGQTLILPMGASLLDVYAASGLQMPYGPTSAKVNNKVEGLHYVAYNNKDVEFLDVTSLSGLRTYVRSLIFVLYKAVRELYPTVTLRLQMAVSNGYYFDLEHDTPLSEDEVRAIRERMQAMIDRNMRFHRETAKVSEVAQRFREEGLEAKAKLLESYGKLYTHYYTLGETSNYFYGSLLVSTGQIHAFEVEAYADGLLLRIPSSQSPGELKPVVAQSKMFEVFREHHRWLRIMGVSNIGEFNQAIADGRVADLIHVSEALQEKKIATMADQIVARPEVRIVLISGPSSSGKTTFSKRLSVQLMACGLRPVAISADDYFVDREDTPRAEDGSYDFEHLEAVNIPRLTGDLQRLLAGEAIELPRFNFHTGKGEPSGHVLQIDDKSIIIIEGIHALNPAMLPGIPDEVKFKIYASALTSIMLDEHNYIPTSDNRLLRRIIRDSKYRGYSAADTIGRWESVQAGERKWIFPFQEEADVMFNTALLFELGVLRDEAIRLLEEVSEAQPEYSEASRLLKFLSYLKPLTLTGLPPTSLLREFMGGSTFTY